MKLIKAIVRPSKVDDIEAIMTATRTGKIGDGHVFVIAVEQGSIIRTGELDTV